MRRTKHLCLVFFTGSMLTICFYTCTAYVLAALSRHPIPLSASGGIITLAALITFCHHRRGWRPIFIFCIQAGGCLLSTLWLFHRYFDVQTPLWYLVWIPNFLTQERNAFEWLAFLSILICAGILWRIGKRLCTRPTTAETISHRFDLGLGFILGMFIIKLLVAVKGGVTPLPHSSTVAVLTYLVLGLFSLGLVRTVGEKPSGGTAYLKGVGVVMSFTAVILGLAGGWFLLFLTERELLADTGMALLEIVSESVGPVVVGLIRWAFTFGGYRESGQISAGSGLAGGVQTGADPGILTYLFLGLTFVILLVTTGFLLYYLLHWFLLKTSEKAEVTQTTGGIWNFLFFCLRTAIRFFMGLRHRSSRPSDPSSAAQKLYKRLKRWGRFSGLGALSTETPIEYGKRLKSRFPDIEKEIEQIICLHDDVTYGSHRPDVHRLADASSAWRRIRTPALWYTRAKSLYFQDRF